MSPTIVRRWLLPLHERLLGRKTLGYLQEMEVAQWWSLERLQAMQVSKLRRLLSHAYSQCPFYRRRMEAAGVDPSLADHDALRRLPCLTKDDIRQNEREIIDAAAPGGLVRCTTGGSTGAPLAFMIDRRRQAADQAARARSRRWFGVDLGERELYLWGSPIEATSQDRVKRLRDLLTNHKLLNAFRMTPRRMDRYLDDLRRYDPVHLFGYPSTLARLARHAVQRGDRLQTPSLRAVFVTGEVFSPSDRAVIEEAVSVPVADGYGAREAGFIAHQCPQGAYHVTMESVIVELLDESGRPVAAPRSGEIVVTHLDAFGMPFIRYRTGDLAAWSSAPCSCGRKLAALERIEGRRADLIRTADGGTAHALSLIYVLREEAAIRDFKIVQDARLDVDVWLTAPEGLSTTARRRIERRLRRQIGGEAAVRIHQVDEIPSALSGKHRCVVSLAENLRIP